ncbi:hypothetical protein BH10PAT3_BH10PAT3_2580 [soil metagenome]
MNAWGLGLIVGALIAAAASFCWVAYVLSGGGLKTKSKIEVFSEAAEKDVERIFNDDFREELRNRARLHFEKIIGENAMFLQQDLRLTTSQLNEYMKGEITKTLQEEFGKYEQSIDDAKQLAIDSIAKTQSAIEEERQVLHANLEKEFEAERERLVKRFEEHMAEIVNHYVLDAVGNEIDLSNQLEYILGEMESNKAIIVEDIRSGA